MPDLSSHNTSGFTGSNTESSENNNEDNVTEYRVGGSTPLNLAVMRNVDIKIIKIFVDAGADLETTDDKGMTPFLWAVRNANQECVEYLVNAGANMQATNNGGQTALHICAGGGKLFFE